MQDVKEPGLREMLYSHIKIEWNDGIDAVIVYTWEKKWASFFFPAQKRFYAYGLFFFYKYLHGTLVLTFFFILFILEYSLNSKTIKQSNNQTINELIS